MFTNIQDSATTLARQTADKLTIELAEKNEVISILRAEIESLSKNSAKRIAVSFIYLCHCF